MRCRNFSKYFTCLESMTAYHPPPVNQEEWEQSAHFFNFMEQLMQVNPAKRITPEQALKHRYIAQKSTHQSFIKKYIRSIPWSTSSSENSTSGFEDEQNTAGSSRADLNSSERER
ncbi:hypothetical protein WMY93_007617 [Mugilogobius chulae]|uniref:Uncharacterized protein n=1 Tax=Mugilogobius chulae TaxID=88201 RepID=A0AAW0PGK9_9GOBI